MQEELHISLSLTYQMAGGKPKTHTIEMASGQKVITNTLRLDRNIDPEAERIKLQFSRHGYMPKAIARP